MFNWLPQTSSLRRVAPALAPALLLGTLALTGGVQADPATSAASNAATTPTTMPATKGTAEKALTEKLAKQHMTKGEVIESINDYELDGWNYVDNNHIVIHTGPSKHYLITLMTSCHDLSTAENIAFTTTVNRLTKFDKLMVRGPGGIVQHCPITQINALTKTKDES